MVTEVKKKDKQFSNSKMTTSKMEVGNILKSTLSSYRIDKKIEEYSAFPEWRDIVGEATSKVAVVEKIIRGKILVVKVLDAAWAQELSMQKQELIEKVNKTERGAIIEDIKFLTGDPRSIKNKR